MNERMEGCCPLMAPTAIRMTAVTETVPMRLRGYWRVILVEPVLRNSDTSWRKFVIRARNRRVVLGWGMTDLLLLRRRETPGVSLDKSETAGERRQELRKKLEFVVAQA